MSTSFHVAISVDIDRFDDAKLKRDYLPFFEHKGCKTVDDVRRLCIKARSRGQAVFAPCGKTLPDGSCAGHSDADLGLAPDLRQTGGARG